MKYFEFGQEHPELMVLLQGGGGCYRGATWRRLAGHIRAWQDAGYAFTYKVFPNMGHGTLAGEHTEQFRREMLTAHAQTLAKAGNKAGKETPYEGAY